MEVNSDNYGINISGGELNVEQLAVGSNAHAEKNVVSQSNSEDFNLKVLYLELCKIRESLESQDIPDEHAIEVLAVTKAEKAAQKFDEPTVRKILQKSGSWTLELAKQIGAPVLTAILEHQLGLK